MKDSSKKNNILTLKDLQQVKSDLITSEQELTENRKHIIFDIVHDLDKRTTKDGEVIDLYFSCAPFAEQWKDGDYIYIDRLNKIFGLEVRSYYGVYYYAFSGGVIMARYGVQPVRLLGVTRSADRKTVYIGAYRSKILYFYDSQYSNDFITYQNQEQEKDNARKYCALVKIANRVKDYTIQLLNQYAGKKLGEKTRDAINDQIRTYAKSIGGDSYGGYISTYYNNINVYKCNTSVTYYINIIDNNNTILHQDPEQIPSKPELDAVKEWEKCEKLRPEIRKKAAELYALVREYDDHASNINREHLRTDSLYGLSL